jgi:type II secretory pathway component GspD/PulD (secretin)
MRPLALLALVFPAVLALPAALADDESDVLLELRVYEAPAGTASRVLGAEALDGLVYGRDRAADAVARLAATPGVTVVASPRLVAREGESASIDVTRPLAYVRDFAFRTEGGATVADPLVDVVPEGLQATATPALSGDGRFVEVEIRIERRTVRRPVPRRAIALASGGRVEVEVPEVVTSRLGPTTVVLPDGDLLLLGPRASDRGAGVELFALVSASRVRAPAPGPPMIEVEARVFAAPSAFVLGIADGDLPDPTDRVRTIPGGRAEALATAIEDDPRVTAITSPRLTALDGQHATLSVLNETSYVKDFEVEEEGGRRIASPVVDVVQDGLVFDVTPDLLPGGRIHLETQTTWAALKRPVAEFSTTLEGTDVPVTIQVPELKVSRFAHGAEAGPGDAVLLGPLLATEHGDLFVLIRAAEVDVAALGRR